MFADSRSSSSFSRMGPALVVIGAHIAVLYGIALSTGVMRVPQVTRPIEAVFLPAEEMQPEPEQPVIEPEIENVVQVDEPMPQVEFEEAPVVPPSDVPMPASNNAIAATPSETAPAVARELKTSSRPDPIYPAQSRRLNEEGTVRVKVLVDERGRPQEVSVAKSSGFERLDQAAIEAVRKWRFVAATDGRSPIMAWTQVAVTFQLTTS
jgi:periplasmic protein TonB